MTQALNVLALVKDAERYLFVYDDDSANVLIQQLSKLANDDELSLTWYDAAVLSQKVRRLRDETTDGGRT